MKKLLFTLYLALFLIACDDDSGNEPAEEEIPVPTSNYFIDIRSESTEFEVNAMKKGFEGFLNQPYFKEWCLGVRNNDEDLCVRIINFEREEIAQNIFEVKYELEFRDETSALFLGDLVETYYVNHTYELSSDILAAGEATMEDYRNSLSGNIQFIANASGFGTDPLTNIVSGIVSDQLAVFLIGNSDAAQYEAYELGFMNALSLQVAIANLEAEGKLPLPVD